MYFSKYHTIVDVDDKCFLFNTFNSSIIELDQFGINEYNQIKEGNFDNISDETKNLLIEEEFIVNSINDDIKRNDMIIDSYIQSKKNDFETLKIDIAITNNCNFHCSYCFENGNKDNYIHNSIDTKSKEKLLFFLLEYFNSKIKDGIRKINIVWYGGEPSLEYDFILNANLLFADFCLNNNLNYGNTIITNGFYLPDNFLKSSKEQCIEYIQTTLDGTKDYHNKRRNIDNVTDSFNVILNNIQKLINNDIETVIRVNIDKKNKKMILKLIDEILSFFPKELIGKKLFIDFGRVFGSEYSFSLLEYEKEIEDILLYSIKNNLKFPNLNINLLSAFCNAECDNSNMVIDFMGNKYFCWNDVFDNSKIVKNIYDDRETNYLVEKMYIEDLSLENINHGECLKCELINYCRGLCSHTRLKAANSNNEEYNDIYNDFKCKDIAKRQLYLNIKSML